MNLEENLQLLAWFKERFECSEPYRCCVSECRNFYVIISYEGQGDTLPYQQFYGCIFCRDLNINGTYMKASCSNSFCFDHKDKLKSFKDNNGSPQTVCEGCVPKVLQLNWTSR